MSLKIQPVSFAVAQVSSSDAILLEEIENHHEIQMAWKKTRQGIGMSNLKWDFNDLYCQSKGLSFGGFSIREARSPINASEPPFLVCWSRITRKRQLQFLERQTNKRTNMSTIKCRRNVARSSNEHPSPLFGMKNGSSPSTNQRFTGHSILS